MPTKEMSPKEVLALYEHIDLTEDEEIEGRVWAKQRKEAILRDDQIKKKEAENRKRFTEVQWDFDQTKAYMLYRAQTIFDGFAIDSNNKFLFDLLCYYFSNNEKFISLGENSKMITNPSLDKGVLLAGNCGVGKTWLMKLFSKNQRQVFHIANAKLMADSYEAKGQEKLDSADYVNKIKNPINDSGSFFHIYAGLCIDDIGTEDVKAHYANKKNVIGDLIEKRYAAENMGIFFHGTTNLTSKQLLDFYGSRVVSRLRESVNYIEVKGSDRRK